MTYQRDPNDPMAGRKTGMGMRRDDGSWGVFPAVLGVIFLLLVGLIAYNMYSGDTASNRANPTASNSTTNTNPAPTTPPAATPPTAPTATPPANK